MDCAKGCFREGLIGLGIVFAVLGSATVVPAPAQSEGRVLRVSTFVLPPYVMPEGDHLTGFSIDLWNAAAARMKVTSEFQLAADVDATLKAVQANDADVGVSGVFITADRDKYVDFTVSILEAGLQVMVPSASSVSRSLPAWNFFRVIFSWSFLIWMGVAALFVVIPAHVFWLVERRSKNAATAETAVRANYFPGIFDAAIWTFTTLMEQMQQSPRRPLARVFAVVWMFAGVVFVAYFTAQLTATLTVAQFQGAINGPDDLPGKDVASLKPSTSVDYLRSHNAKIDEVPDTDAMFRALRSHDVDAILFSAPTLRYYAAHDGKGLVRLVGPEFGKLDLGFVVPIDSPLRREINAALLALRQDGTYGRIYDRWFGDE